MRKFLITVANTTWILWVLYSLYVIFTSLSIGEMLDRTIPHILIPIIIQIIASGSINPSVWIQGEDD